MDKETLGRRIIRILTPGLIFVLCTWGVFFIWIWRNVFFENENGIFASSRTVWADWAAHLAYAARFAYQPTGLWLENNPIFFGARFNYPFFTNLLSGLLIRSGVNIVDAFVIPSIIFTIGLLIVLYFFYRRLLSSDKAAILAVFLFFLNGGLGFLQFLGDILHVQNPWSYLFFPPREYTFLPNQNLQWCNVIHCELLPQRGILLGLFSGLLILLLTLRLLDKYENRPKPDQIGLLWFFLLGLFAGVLPLVHGHTFLSMVVTAGIIVLNTPRYKYPYFFTAIIGAGLIALLAGVLILDPGKSQGWLAFRFGWMTDWKSAGFLGFIWFWFWNWGLFLPLAIAGTYFLRLWENPIVLSGWVLFILCNIFRFQPWEWDNAKILTWSWLFLCIPVTEVLVLTWRKDRFVLKAVATFFTVSLVFSGTLELIRLVNFKEHTFQMWSRSKIELAEKFRPLVGRKSTVLTPDEHLNWVSSLAGAQILLGYKGWLWSYGIDYSHREIELKTMYAGGPAAEDLFRQFRVQFVVLNSAARNEYHANSDYFRKNFRLIFKDEDTEVYGK